MLGAPSNLLPCASLDSSIDWLSPKQSPRPRLNRLNSFQHDSRVTSKSALQLLLVGVAVVVDIAAFVVAAADIAAVVVDIVPEAVDEVATVAAAVVHIPVHAAVADQHFVETVGVEAVFDTAAPSSLVEEAPGVVAAPSSLVEEVPGVVADTCFVEEVPAVVVVADQYSLVE